MEISGNVAVITGGASGLGRATAESWIEKGGKVAILDMNEDKGAPLADRLGENCIFINTNVVEEASVVKDRKSVV